MPSGGCDDDADAGRWLRPLGWTVLVAAGFAVRLHAAAAFWSRSTTRCASASRGPSSGFRPACTARLPSSIRDSTGGASASRTRCSRLGYREAAVEPGPAPWAVCLGGIAGARAPARVRAPDPPRARRATSRSGCAATSISDIREIPRRRLGRRRAARARAARRLLRARARAARAGAARRRAAAPRRRGARGRGPALRDPLGDRLPPHRGRDAREPARGRDRAGRQHAHAAAREELLPDARAHAGGASCARRAWP